MPETEKSALNMYLAPFSKIIWILLIFVILTTTVVHAIYTISINNTFEAYITKTNSSHRNSHRYRLTMQQVMLKLVDSFFCIISTFLRQTYQSLEPKKKRQKLLFGSFWIFGFFVATFWSADIMSHLSITIQPRPIKTFDDLLNQKTYKYGTNGGTIFEVLLSTSNNTLYKKLWANIKSFAKDDPEILSRNVTTHLRKVLDGNYICLEDLETAKAFASEHCDIALMDDEIMEYRTGLTLQDNSVFKLDFNDFMIKMLKGGILNKMYRQFIMDATCEDQKPTATHRPILLSQLMPIFYVLFSVVLFSTFVYIIEIFWIFMVGNKGVFPRSGQEGKRVKSKW